MTLAYTRRAQPDCATCEPAEGSFCAALPDIRNTMTAAGVPISYPRGAVLFVEGKPARSVFVVCEGKLKLTTSSAEGRTLIVQIAEPGDVLGLSAALLGRGYETSAEAIEPVHVTCLSRDTFLGLASSSATVALELARQLSSTFDAAQHEIRRLVLSQTTLERLIRLLLDWCAKKGEKGPGGVRLHLSFTHEELGQMIGTTRETVTRALSELRRKEALVTRGSTMYVNTAVLEMLLS